MERPNARRACAADETSATVPSFLARTWEGLRRESAQPTKTPNRPPTTAQATQINRTESAVPMSLPCNTSAGRCMVGLRQT